MTGSSKPSALDWAAIVALPNVCTALVGCETDLNAQSIVGSPIYYTLVSQRAINENIHDEVTDFRRWNWPWRRKVVKNLINAGAQINNVYGSKRHIHTQSVIEIIFRYWPARIDDSDDQILQLVLDTNPQILHGDHVCIFEICAQVEEASTGTLRGRSSLRNLGMRSPNKLYALRS